MKLHLIIVVLLGLASQSFGQTPSASPTTPESASPESTRVKPFGSSLEKYEDKQRRSLQSKQGDELADGETIRVTTNLVINDVLVTTQNGKIINELNKGDFNLTEDGTPQTIEVFSGGENANCTALYCSDY